MSEARAPNYELAELDYLSGMKYKDIAEKYNVTLNTVKSWKTRYKWSKDNKKSVHTKSKKVCTHDEPIVEEVKQVMDNPELTDKQRLFCLYYSKNFNAAMSYVKAYGCEYESALASGPRLLGNAKIKEELQALREIKLQQLSAGEADLVDLHMRIAFADMGDFIEIKNNSLLLKSSNVIDTQLINEVKEGKYGMSIKLIDRCKSMDWLDRYFLINPMDRHKIEYDKRKLELDIIKLDYEAKKNEPIQTATTGNDNFLEVLNTKALEVWNDDE